MHVAEPKGVFITGTDTGVGKTVFACRLIKILEANNLHTAPRKPVESGCTPNDEGGLTASDAIHLAGAMKQPPPIEEICKFRFQAATSPARAAKIAKVQITLDHLITACSKHDDEIAVVEGAGGLLSPIVNQYSNANLVIRLGLPIILVVADKLGCVNHTLLSLMAADSLGIKTLAIILNRLPQDASQPDEMNNFEELKMLINVPIIKMENVDKRAQKIIALITEG